MNREKPPGEGLAEGEATSPETSRVREELAAMGLRVGGTYKFSKGDLEFVATLETGLLGGSESILLLAEDGRSVNVPSLDGFEITQFTQEEEEAAAKRVEDSRVSDADDWYG